MRPVAIFRFSMSEGPAYFAEWLDARGIAHELIAIDQGARVPADPRAYSGIGMMGGPMSANDALPWVEPLSRLLREAVDARVPIVGHCLGGQLLSRALGGTVVRSPTPEIGWGEVEVEDDDSRSWFGGRSRFTTFQWHYDTFSVPPRAQRLLRNDLVPNQAYVLDDLHVGFQCHVEMTETLVRAWCDLGKDELPASSAGGVQSAEDIERDMPKHLPTLRAVADAFYSRWSQGLAGVRAPQLAATTQE